MKTFNHHPAFKFHEEFMGGNLWRFGFDNGYGASVVCHEGSYGNEKGLFELAVTKEGKLDYSTPIANDVIGFEENIGRIYHFVCHRIKKPPKENSVSGLISVF